MASKRRPVAVAPENTRQSLQSPAPNSDNHKAAVSPASEYTNRVQPYLALVGGFLACKAILLVVVLLTPADGSGYDTSTDLFLRLNGTSVFSSNESRLLRPSPLVSRIATKLTRWDAFYFVSASWKGYVHEQDWAFSFGYTAVVGRLSHLFRISRHEATNIVLNGMIITNICHLLSTITLWRLASLLLPASAEGKQIAYLAAVLHIISPAGVFLLAPYSEAPFAFLNFLAQLLYAKAISARSGRDNPFFSNVYIVTSGILFGLSAMVRSNGLLNGIIFACDAVLGVSNIVFGQPRFAWSDIRLLPSLWATILAGLATGAGFAYPQLVAYREYCTMQSPDAVVRTWCEAVPPSIYTFVQAEYWNTGFLKYWTLSNVPLFILAAPMLFVLSWTCRQAIFQTHAATLTSSRVSTFVLFRLALPQLLIALLTLMTAHVQIVIRLSTGYAVWYLYLASAIVTSNTSDKQWPKSAVQVMVMYAIVQAALFSAFLPPA